jgi:hypothetical protein
MRTTEGCLKHLFFFERTSSFFFLKRAGGILGVDVISPIVFR